MAYETYKMAKSTKTSVEEMHITRKEANSAEVIAYLKVESHRIYLIIENRLIYFMYSSDCNSIKNCSIHFFSRFSNR